MAVVRNEETSSVLVCARHFEAIRDSVRSYLEVPTWLMEGNGLLGGDGGVVYQFDLGPNGE
jgi:hypothetical protein